MANFINIYKKLDSGDSLTINNTDEEIEVYTRILVLGAQNATVGVTLNGVSMNLSGGVDFKVPNIESLSCSGGEGLLVMGYKQKTSIF